MTRKKRVAIYIFCGAFFFSASLSWAGEKKPDTVLKMATLAVEGIGWSKYIKEILFPAIEKATGGSVQVKMYWGGIMGDEEDIIAKMRSGRLQGGGFTGQGAVMLCPEMAVLELPFLFSGYDEVNYIRGKMARAFDRLMEKRGCVLLMWLDQDFDQVYSMRWPITTPEDFAKSRFLTWSGPMEEAVLDALGAKIIAVNVPDIQSAARRQDVDAAIGPAMYIVAAQIHPVVRYVNPIKIRYTPAVAVITVKTWEAIPRKYQDAFLARRDALGRELSLAARKDNEKYLEAIVQYGVKRTDSAPGDVVSLKVKTRKVWDRMAGVLYSRELLETLLNHLEEYRAAHGEGR